MSKNTNKTTKFVYVKNLRTKKADVSTSSIKTILNHIARTKVGYEVIQSACIPYYDFEREYDSEEKRLEHYDTDLSFATQAIRTQFPRANRVYEFTACGFDNVKKVYKNSFHFRIRGVGYYARASLVPKIEGFDPAVYNDKSQLFRLPYCSKKDQNRPLKRFDSEFGEVMETPEDCEAIGETFDEYLVQNIEGEELKLVCAETSQPSTEVEPHKELVSCVEVVQKYIDLAKTNSTIFDNMAFKSSKQTDAGNCIINFRRLSSSHCPTCKRTHDCDATPYITANISSNKLFWCCIRNTSHKFLCKIDESIPDLSPEHKPSVQTSLYLSSNVFHEKYCTSIAPMMDAIKTEDVRTIAVKSNMGTGKTYACAQAMSNQTKLRVGVISFRISLAKKYSDDFKGFTCYTDKKERVIDDARWICQLDSLHRIKLGQPLDKLFLDECCQLIRHLTADTFMRNRNYLANRAALKTLIRTAKQVIIMDANLTAQEIEWIANLRSGVEDALVIHNTYTSHERVFKIDTKYHVIQNAQRDYAAGRKFVIAHNGSTTKQIALARQITNTRNLCGKILVINSETMSDPEVKSALANPNIEFGKYAGVIYSPSVQSGLSYDTENVIHSIYGIFGNWSNSSGDICQMLHRIRHPISNLMIMSVDQVSFGNAKPTTAKAMMRHLKAGRAHIHSSSKDKDVLDIIERIPFDYNNYGEIDFVESDILKEYCTNRAEHNLDSINFKANFIKHQLSYGNKLWKEQEVETKEESDKKKADQKQEVGIKVELKTQVEEVNLEVATALSEASVITLETAATLKKNIQEKPDSVSKDEYIQFKKYNVNKLYRVREVSSDPQWYLRYSDSTLKKHYLNTSIYYRKKQAFSESLKDLRKRECVSDAHRRLNIDESKSTDECIVDSILTKPKFMKHNVIINWLTTLGFDSLTSNAEVSDTDLKVALTLCLGKFDEALFDILEKQHKGLVAMKKLKHTDPTFIKNCLQFMNGSLKVEFGVSIKKKSKNSTQYILDNTCVANEVFIDPYSTAQGTCDGLYGLSTPVLGSHEEEVSLLYESDVDDDSEGEDIEY